MNNVRIVFMGTPDFAVATLDELVQQGLHIVGVITAPDRPAGRGRKLQESAVKKYAIEKGLTVLQPTNLKATDFLEDLRELQADLQIVVAFRMLPKVVWSMPAKGTFNLHASLLPDYRGAAPINWAIMNGEQMTGATTFFIDDKIDTGEIILQEKLPISEKDTAGSLHDRLMVLGAKLVYKTVEAIVSGTVQPKKQEVSKMIKTAHKLFKDNCVIDWNKSLQDIYNHIRGLSPYPTAWTKLQNGEDSIPIKIYHTEMEERKHSYNNGHLIFDKKEIRVAVKGGFLKLLEIQLAGKRKMKTQEVLNGLSLEKNARVG
ncbi:methionyl-tRNA formyltransferase [Spongiimicrobium salis]|uniref:methionyl-tRNA formyltransferase n=1 Tax=Spongiimicrobium salis TaxID=1667022 RepID=UPI00374D75AE